MKNLRHCLVPVLLLAATSACTVYDEDSPDFGYRYAEGDAPVYSGGGYGTYGVGGDGANALDPWLSGTRQGQHLILAHFDRNEDGRIGIDRAGEANRWFRRFADRNGDLALTDNEINRGLTAVDRALQREGY